tara:strand:+ start:446 stop:1102 length:657 start_codon:yes stop_codon:yes gene_type:complete
MSFIDDSELNVMSIMKEATAVGGVGGFIGRAGRDIDQLFAGAYHPDSGHGSENEDLLQYQLDHRKELRSDIGAEGFEKYGQFGYGTESPIGGYFADLMNTEQLELAFNELQRYDDMVRAFNREKTPNHDDKWTDIDSKELKIDEPGEAYKDRTFQFDDYGDPYKKTDIQFDNYGDPYKKTDIKFDDYYVPYEKNDFINASEQNWQNINKEINFDDQGR